MPTKSDPNTWGEKHGHARLNAMLVELRTALLCENWDSCCVALERFIVAFESHLREEEEHEFPRYAASSAGGKREIQRLLSQHKGLRRRLGQLSTRIREQRADHGLLEQFRLAWRIHEDCENLSFLRWRYAVEPVVAHSAAYAE